MPHYSLSLAAIALAALSLCGCSGPNAQLARCQEDKEQLLVTIREQRDTARTLRHQVASLESRLDQSEKELARSSGGTRVSSRPSEKPPLKSEPLPWRAPPEKESSPGVGTGAR